MRTRVKICGITRREDALFCADQGVDAIGLVFYPRSRRYIEPDKAKTISRAIYPFTSIVGLFMDASETEVRHVLDTMHLDMLQFHGQENGTFCEQFDMPYIKAIPMGENGHDFSGLDNEFLNASGFLLDSHGENKPGGSGQTFNWAAIPESTPKKLILAGGLTPDNVQSAIREVRPYAVDCSSGVESQPGIKDHTRIRLFMEQVADV